MGGGTNPPSPIPSTTPNPAQTFHPLPLPLRVLTQNIRYATPTPFPGEKPWEIRKPKLCAQLLYHTRNLPHSIIFLQEVLHRQLVDVLDSLNSRGDLSGEDLATERWDYLGVGRDDGCEAGEFSPIFFKRDVWRKMTGSEETVWLNETGEVGKKGWDAGSVRILVCVVLEDVDVRRGKKGKRVLLMNTHLDDQGRRSREESARIILRELKDRSERWDVDAVVLGGDFNSETDGDAYPIIANFEESGVVDVRMLAEGEQVYGEENTFTGFDGRGDGEELKRIDFLFLGTRKEDNFFDLNTPAYAVLPNRFEDGVYLSDHRAVVADLVI